MAMSKRFNALVWEKKMATDRTYDQALAHRNELERRIEELRRAQREIASLGRASTLLDGLLEWEGGARTFHVAFVRSFAVDAAGALTELKAFRDVTMGDAHVPIELRQAYCRENGLAMDEARRAYLRQCPCGGRRIRVMQRWDDDSEGVARKGIEIGEFCVACHRYKTKHEDSTIEALPVIEAGP